MFGVQFFFSYHYLLARSIEICVAEFARQLVRLQDSYYLAILALTHFWNDIVKYKMSDAVAIISF